MESSVRPHPGIKKRYEKQRFFIHPPAVRGVVEQLHPDARRRVLWFLPKDRD